MESSNEIEEKSQVGEGRACWSLGNAHSAMGETESAYHYASRSFSRLGEFSFKTYAIFVKTYAIFDLLDILTLQERLEIEWGKPLLRSNESAIKCISKNKAPCIFDLLAMADYFSTRIMSGQSERTRENSWIC